MKKNYALPAVLIAVLALSRWPGLMPPNFSAVYAMVFCAGLYLPGFLGWGLTFGVLLGTDFLLSRFYYSPNNFSFSQFLVGQGPNCLGYAGILLLGRLLGPRRAGWKLVGGGILGAIWFYLVTNTASWVVLPYAKTFAGWIQALTGGLPPYPPTWVFFRNTLLSGGIFTGLFVGSMKLMEKPESADEEAEAESTPEAEHEPETNPAKAEP